MRSQSIRSWQYAEGNLIPELGSSAIGTLVERTIRFTVLLHLPRMKEYGIARMKNGPALAGHGAAEIGNEIATSTKNWLPQLRKSLTWDQGAEMAKHSKLQVDMALRIYFCEPLSP